MLSALVHIILVKSSLQATLGAGCAVGGGAAISDSNTSSSASCPYTSLLQIGQNSETFSTDRLRNTHVRESHVHKVKGNILYVVRTWHKNYNTRLPSILQTWAAPLDRSSLLLVGDQELQSPTVHAATGCGSDHHLGLTCKTGHSLALAAEMIGQKPWAFVIDDDVYVNTSHLESLLQKHDSSKLVALGIPGCGTPHCDDHEGGFCGGGGYALSQAALKALIDRPKPEDFHNELQDMTKVFYPGETPWDDITTTCLMKRRGISIEKIDGLYGWRIPDGSHPAPDGKLTQLYKAAIHSSNPTPLTFHYVSPEEMYTIHKQFTKGESGKVSLLQEVNVASSYAEQLQLFIEKDHLRRRNATQV